MLHKRIDINKTAYFDTYILDLINADKLDAQKPLVVILPGGSYVYTSDREAEPMALKFNSIGIHAVVLRYTTHDKVKNIPKNALIETASTIKYIREKAKEWGVDKDKIIVCGFSAGGNLALQMATKWHQSWLSETLKTTPDMLKVNLAIPSYPVVHVDLFDDLPDRGPERVGERANTVNERIFGVQNPTEKEKNEYDVLQHVDQNTPPMFIWGTYEDTSTTVSNFLALANRLTEVKIPYELHVFEKGGHGLALADRTTATKDEQFNPQAKKWFDLCEGWLSHYID